jgi:hypothetical protein
MRASQTSCNKDATRMMERQAQREREREREREWWWWGGAGAWGGFQDKCNSQATQNETLRDQGLGFKED